MYQERTILGVRFETPGHKAWMHHLSRPLVETYFFSRTTISGKLPPEGAAILASNHISWGDLYFAQFLSEKIAGRTSRSLAKATLLDPDAPESDFVIQRRTQYEVGKSNGLLKGLIELPMAPFRRYAIPWYVGHFDTIEIDIGQRTERTERGMKQVFQELTDGHLVWFFVQGTRAPKFDLLDTLDGAAVVALRSGAPVYPIGLSGVNTNPFDLSSIQINIGEPFTKDDIPKVEDLSRVEAASRFIADKIAAQISDPRYKAAWRLNRVHGLDTAQIEAVYRKYPELYVAADFLDSVERNFSPQEKLELLMTVDKIA